MRIAVISDSHGQITNLNKAIMKMGHADVVFHLGDFVRDVNRIRKDYEGKIYSLMGNCDFTAGLASLEDDFHKEVLTIVGGKRIYATHGHRYRVKNGLSALYYRAKEVEADIVLFGHTHCSQVTKEDNIVFMNPGSTSAPRCGSNPSFGIIEIIKGNIISEIVNIYP